MTTFKGIFGATYNLPDTRNVKVTKKDGQEFYLPVEDCLKIVEVLTLLHEEEMLQQKIGTLHLNRNT